MKTLLTPGGLTRQAIADTNLESSQIQILSAEIDRLGSELGNYQAVKGTLEGQQRLADELFEKITQLTLENAKCLEMT